MTEIDYDTYEADGIRVEWVDIGEGIDGYYNPDDPDDVELLRFDVRLNTSEWPTTDFDDEPDEDGWYQAQDSSYCTQVPVSTPPEERLRLLQIIHANAGDHDMAMMSWIAPGDWVPA